MKLFASVYIAAASLCVGCGSQPESKGTTPIVITMDQEAEPLQDSAAARIFTAPSYLTLHGALIGEIERILDWGDRYVIFDRKQSGVYLFDTTGNLIRKVGRQGKGPQEYIRVSGVALTNDSLALYADEPNKMMYYDREGLFIREHPVDNRFRFLEGIAYGGSGQFYGVQPANRGASGYTIGTIDENATADYLPFNDWPAPVVGGLVVTAADSNRIWISRPFDPCVYRVEAASAAPEPQFVLDFGKGNFSTGYAAGMEDFDLIMKAMKERVVLHCASVCQVGHYVMLRAMPDYWLLDPNSRTAQKIDRIDAGGGLVVYARRYIPVEYQTRKIAIQVDPFDLKQQIEQGELKRTPTIDSLLRIDQESSNPILVLFRVSENV